MSNRYTQLFLLPQNLYSEGAPILIEAGALLNDSQTNKILAQLKYKNLQVNSIKAMNVRIQPMDVLGNPLGDAISFQYLDLAAEYGESFGSKIPINMPDNTARSFSAEVCSVVFDDNSVWETTGAAWEKLDEPICFNNGEDDELQKQYQLLYGSKAIYQLHVTKDLWQCVCGTVNKNPITTCSECCNSLEELRRFDMNALKEACAQRLDSEAAEAAAKQKIRRKLAIVIGALITIAALILLWNSSIHPFIKYSKAVSLMNDGNYTEAISGFEELVEYKDSVKKIEECHLAIKEEVYQNALACMNSQQYQQAYNLFDTITEYRDSKNLATESRYQEGLQYWNNKEYDTSNQIFTNLGSYKDCKALIHTHKYNTENIEIEATCHSLGVMRYSCDCGKSHTGDIAMIDHEYKSKVTTAATCTTKGVKTFTCAVCSDSYTESIAATGHNYDKGKVTTAPTCTAKGIKTFSCVKCDNSYTETIKTKDHSYDQGKITAAATCTTKGIKTFTCTSCKTSYTESIAALGHAYTSATCTTGGKCQRCSAPSEPLGHTTTTATCDRCNYNFTKKIIASNLSTDYTISRGKYKMTIEIVVNDEWYGTDFLDPNFSVYYFDDDHNLIYLHDKYYRKTGTYSSEFYLEDSIAEISFSLYGKEYDNEGIKSIVIEPIN